MKARWLARALTLALVAASASGCCTALDTVCGCLNCLLSGPNLPGAAPEAEALTPPEAALPTARRSSMSY